MNEEVTLLFIDPDGRQREIGTTKDWRFQKGSGLSGFSSFDGELSFSDNYFRDGGSTDNIRLSGKSRTIKIVYTVPDEEDIERDRFTDFFRYKTKYKIYATYMGRTRWAECILYKGALSERTNRNKAMDATLTFQFDNPYWLSVDDFGKNIAAVSPGAGFPWLCPVGVGCAIGVFNFAHEVTLRNDGDSDAYPIIRIDANDNVVNPVVQINNGFVRYMGTLHQHDQLVMDFNSVPPTIQLNGKNVIGKCDRASTFEKMLINKGNNIVSFDADNGSDELEVFVIFNKQYTVI